MREVIMIHVGGCGTSIGAKVWETIMPEHGLDAQGTVGSQATDMQKEMLNIYFHESRGGRYVPRAVLVDSEPGNLDRIRAGDCGHVFRSDAYVSSRGTGGGVFAMGYYQIGSEIIDQTLDALRREVETTDSFQGFQLTKSLGGGTGSGFGTLLLSKLSEEFGYNNMVHSFNIAPNRKNYEGVTEPYNAILSLGMDDSGHPSTLMDNQALMDLAKKKLGVAAPRYSDLNRIVAKGIAGITAALRFPGIENWTMRKICTNMIPFPRLCLSMMSHTLSTQNKSSGYQVNDTASLMKEAFHPGSYFGSSTPSHGRYLTAFASLRGKIPSSDAEQEAKQVLQKNSSYFVEWIPHNLNLGIGFQSPTDTDSSVSVLANSTSIQECLKSYSECFTAMFRRKSFLCWYTGAGLDEFQFTSAESKINDVVSEYQQYQDATSHDDGGGEVEE